MSLTGCHADPAKGSNEKWLSQVDTQAVIVGENYYMPDFDQNQIMIWNFSDQSLRQWDFFEDAQMPSGKIRRITSQTPAGWPFGHKTKKRLPAVMGKIK